ncbi:hypothetical protein HUA74_09810 [Myxococcus sp. CA051A]|uniref:MlpA protein n=1 Tax=Myxococcus llanfairpwllgwyngyllgogerychwyrndrobwllllantysiliogogogochensis TaxID=2590453 RepID=A0A540X911_9BACT|nr:MULTISPECIES: hypothetical protein [Myxococcus]NTX03273.1 hypothetical protein [Myxococcus sp. CA040A]NTX53137.1 hypothetical protein [Myxococcus sp. CA039A]NTX60954.1 hypothetical protein [Myxococcus sp. CA051A]TQF17793.1 hypothetical protein FJV41_01190 [Myxococcus llanfairpwllgwyngyllgogerychwyrndrobwllllantysiliogogogochensis]
MKTRWMGWGPGVAALVLLAGCGVEDPEPQCVVARAVSDGSIGSFATVYTLLPGQNPDQQCAQLKPEPLGLQKYYSQDPNARDTVAVRSERLGELVADFEEDRPDPDPSHTPFSVGPFSSEGPGADNFCDVPQLSPTRLDVPATATLPAQSFRYEWSNLRIYNTPGIPGTQFKADLTYTENGCTATYQAKGIWPVVGCATKGAPDETKCDPYADYSVGRLRGSGINPLFPVKCDPDALICVLTGDVPSDETP